MTSNTTTISISVTSENIIPWKVNFEIRYSMVKFWFCYPNNSGPSLSGSKLFILIWRKCEKPLTAGNIWTGPVFRLTSPDVAKGTDKQSKTNILLCFRKFLSILLSYYHCTKNEEFPLKVQSCKLKNHY